MKAPTKRLYLTRLQRLENEFQRYPKEIAYLHATWLEKHKHRFVSAWINQHMHLENTSTNRVESHHAKLNKYLHTSIQNFVNSWHTIHNLLELQICDIKSSFEESLTRIPHRYRGYLFRVLIGFVSIYAMQKIEMEIGESDSVGPYPDLCHHVSQTTCGLPCAHMIAEYRQENTPIPLSPFIRFGASLIVTLLYLTS
ncbi:hypothetical protein QJS10_CPB12g00775 [Acorus calamus]|uniref:Protein FAR1-RELATED SEQUENCE n=1 Tax=Acorus calamus TaxID=4465 RepID=A0AAV9DJZ2_ACOCL|nr:hypothetical protein QJS10_CPB12g00775 [Acorus calamus]